MQPHATLWPWPLPTLNLESTVTIRILILIRWRADVPLCAMADVIAFVKIAHLRIKDLGVMDMNQWSFRNLGVPRVIEGPLTVELSLDPEDIAGDPCQIEEDDYVMFVAYATKVDGNPAGSGDGEFIYATPLERIECD